MRYGLYSLRCGDATMDIYVELCMGDEDGRLTMWTTCDLFEPTTSEPSSDLRKTLARISDSHTPPDLHTPLYDTHWAITTFLSHIDPKTFIRALLNIDQRNKTPETPKNLDRVDRILSDLEVGTRGAAHKLMTLRSLKNPSTHTGRTTTKTPILSRIMKTPMTPRDRITFWAGSAIKYSLEDLLSLHLTTNDLVLVKLTVARLAEDPIVIPWP